jgi:superfamily I DNA and/or RNA helicase/very-short-patch-repair endonuclease
LEDLIAENSMELWSSWLKALPHRLNQENRKILGEFNTILNLMVNSSIEKNTPDRSILAKYYKILPKIANILPCWAVTSLSVKGKVPFQPGFFDLVIIDEASQCDISSALPLLYRAKRAVIIGDNKQLSHISTISTNQDIQLLEKYNLGEKNLIWSYVGNSLFGLAQSICEHKHIITLKDHHRSHNDIIDFSNNEFYGGQLRVATNYKKLRSINKEPSLRWENVDGRVITPQSGGAYNEIEAYVVVSELKRIVENNYEGTIGVVSPFRAQADLINKLINKDILLSEKLTNHNFMADTVHRFQGDEKDLIIFSTVISKELPNGAKSFLTKTGNLFNVAITRARSILLVVGDFHECSNSGINYMENFTKYVTKLKTKNSFNNLSIDNLGPEYPIIPWEVRVSDWEKEFYEVLFRVNIKTIPQFRVDQYSLDLALFVGEKKLDIEIDGKHFHQSWDGELMVRDKIRNKRMIELGWDVQRFWVHELQNDLGGCVSKINNWFSNNQ